MVCLCSFVYFTVCMRVCACDVAAAGGFLASLRHDILERFFGKSKGAIHMQTTS